jgi:nitroreductase
LNEPICHQGAMDQIEREPASPSDANGNPWPEDSTRLADLLARRFSCRAYSDKPVPRETIERMLAMAQMSASWCNSQPWQVIVTEGAGTERFRQRIYQYAASGAAAEPDMPFPLAYRGIYKERQREVGWQLYGSVGIAMGDREASGKQAMENFRLFGAPHALLITSERDLGVYGAIDCGLYAGSLALAAESLGLGIILQAAIATYAPLIHEHFGIPDNRVVVMGASLGFPDNTHAANSFRSRRASLEQAVRWVTE